MSRPCCKAGYYDAVDTVCPVHGYGNLRRKVTSDNIPADRPHCTWCEHFVGKRTEGRRSQGGYEENRRNKSKPPIASKYRKTVLSRSGSDEFIDKAKVQPLRCDCSDIHFSPHRRQHPDYCHSCHVTASRRRNTFFAQNEGRNVASDMEVNRRERLVPNNTFRDPVHTNNTQCQHESNTFLRETVDNNIQDEHENRLNIVSSDPDVQSRQIVIGTKCPCLCSYLHFVDTSSACECPRDNKPNNAVEAMVTGSMSILPATTSKDRPLVDEKYKHRTKGIVQRFMYLCERSKRCRQQKKQFLYSRSSEKIHSEESPKRVKPKMESLDNADPVMRILKEMHKKLQSVNRTPEMPMDLKENAYKAESALQPSSVEPFMELIEELKQKVQCKGESGPITAVLEETKEKFRNLNHQLPKEIPGTETSKRDIHPMAVESHSLDPKIMEQITQMAGLGPYAVLLREIVRVVQGFSEAYNLEEDRPTFKKSTVFRGEQVGSDRGLKTAECPYCNRITTNKRNRRLLRKAGYNRNKCDSCGDTCKQCMGGDNFLVRPSCEFCHPNYRKNSFEGFCRSVTRLSKVLTGAKRNKKCDGRCQPGSSETVELDYSKKKPRTIREIYLPKKVGRLFVGYEALSHEEEESCDSGSINDCNKDNNPPEECACNDTADKNEQIKYGDTRRDQCFHEPCEDVVCTATEDFRGWLRPEEKTNPYFETEIWKDIVKELLRNTCSGDKMNLSVLKETIKSEKCTNDLETLRQEQHGRRDHKVHAIVHDHHEKSEISSSKRGSLTKYERRGRGKECGRTVDMMDTVSPNDCERNVKSFPKEPQNLEMTHRARQSSVERIVADRMLASDAEEYPILHMENIYQNNTVHHKVSGDSITKRDTMKNRKLTKRSAGDEEASPSRVKEGEHRRNKGKSDKLYSAERNALEEFDQAPVSPKDSASDSVDSSKMINEGKGKRKKKYKTLKRSKSENPHSSKKRNSTDRNSLGKEELKTRKSTSVGKVSSPDGSRKSKRLTHEAGDNSGIDITGFEKSPIPNQKTWVEPEGSDTAVSEIIVSPVDKGEKRVSSRTLELQKMSQKWFEKGSEEKSDLSPRGEISQVKPFSASSSSSEN